MREPASATAARRPSRRQHLHNVTCHPVWRRPADPGKGKGEPPDDVCLGDCTFTSLQDAVDAAGAGARIQLCPGSFSTNADIVRKKLTLVGAGSGKGGTILDGNRRGRVLFVSESELDARHFTVTGGFDDLGGGILGVGSEITLEGVHFTGNEAERLGGGIIAEDCTTTLIGSRVTDNSASDGGGIYALRGTLRLTAGSTVTGNTATGDPAYAGGVFAFLGATVEISGGSRVSDNTPVDCTGTEVC